MKKIIGTGLSGLVGSRVVELLENEFSFEDISRKTGTDILDGKGILERIQNSEADTVIHMAAYTHVDEAEQEKGLGANSQSWKVNVRGTENIVAACKATGKRLIYISTDFVFDGESTPQKGYSEENIPNPINWYATTKYEGEKRVTQSNIQWVIARIAYPYRADSEKNDFFRAMKQRLVEGKYIAGVTDHRFCPTFIDDIAHALGILCKTSTTGIYHVTGSEALSPNEAAHAIAEVFGLDASLITATTREDYFKGKAQRPFDLSMNNGKIKLLGVQMRGFREGLQELKKQI